MFYLQYIVKLGTVRLFSFEYFISVLLYLSMQMQHFEILQPE